MGFIRTCDQTQIQKMTSGNNAELLAKLKADVLNGEVFPAVRKNELHFYYKGGCLYKFAGGSFSATKITRSSASDTRNFRLMKEPKRRTKLSSKTQREERLNDRFLIDCIAIPSIRKKLGGRRIGYRGKHRRTCGTQVRFTAFKYANGRAYVCGRQGIFGQPRICFAPACP